LDVPFRLFLPRPRFAHFFSRDPLLSGDRFLES
jgi:hypothetical protein